MYQDPAECRRMCEETQKYIREYFSVEAAWKVIEEGLYAGERAVGRPPGRTGMDNSIL